MQKGILVGNLGADAEVRNENGTQFVSFKVADSRRWKDAQGNDHEETVWYSCTLNGDGGKVLQYLKKGTKVLCVGRQSYNVYSSKVDRCMKAGVKMFVESIELIGGQSDSFPRELVDENGQILAVYKAYYIHPDLISRYAGKQLMGVHGGVYQVNANGFLSVLTEQPQQQAAAGKQEATENPAQAEGENPLPF